MARNLQPTEKDAIAKVQARKCPVCDGPLIPRHDRDGSTVRALVCPRHDEFTTPRGRNRVRQMREARDAR